jgi:hypothetical protein
VFKMTRILVSSAIDFGCASAVCGPLVFVACLAVKIPRMPTTRAFMASLVVAFIVLSVLADRSAPQRIVTGTIREFEAGEWLSVATYKTDPKGFPIALRETTAYEGSPTAIKTGARVTIWYRSVGERRFVADKVRVLSDAAPH